MRYQPKVIFEGEHVGSGALRRGKLIRIYDRGRVDIVLSKEKGTWLRACGEGTILAAELTERMKVLEGDLPKGGTYWFDYTSEGQVRRMLHRISSLEKVLRSSQRLLGMADDLDGSEMWGECMKEEREELRFAIRTVGSDEVLPRRLPGEDPVLLWLRRLPDEYLPGATGKLIEKRLKELR